MCKRFTLIVLSALLIFSCSMPCFASDTDIKWNYKLKIQYGDEYVTVYVSCPKDKITIIRDELQKIPKKYIDMAWGASLKGIVVSDEMGYTCYHIEKKYIYLMNTFKAKDISHELAHAIDTNQSLYQNEEFLKVVKNGISELKFTTLIDTRGQAVTALSNSKFVTTWQGQLYDKKMTSLSLDELSPYLIEYWSYGFETYIHNPSLLERKDPTLYNFIENYK